MLPFGSPAGFIVLYHDTSQIYKENLISFTSIRDM